ncbi:MAG: hypothetical protein K0Q65_2130 [Clostridia bacterium]|nr:hypothetical protein [Clostridia bacterium]
MEFIFNAILLVLYGTFVLRLAGRKSISQMTVAQTIIMISIGSLMIQPIANKSTYRTFIVAAVFIATLILLEYLQIKFNYIEKMITGKSKVVIQDGKIVEATMKKLRFSVDQLEIRLRQLGISNIADVKTATLEPNGQIGYELMRHAKPLTVGEFEKLMSSFFQIQQTQSKQSQNINIFDELKQEQHQTQHPPRLQ